MSITVTRRNFMTVAAAGTIGAGMCLTSNALADETVPAAPAADAQQGNPGDGLPWSGAGNEAGDWTGTPEEIQAVGGCTMPLDELNRRRHMYVDSQTDYTKSDGTVIPAVFVKARALLNTYGFGIGCTPSDVAFDWIMQELSEEDAQAYIDMPYGRRFNAIEFAAESGRSIEECKEICEDLFNRAWIGRTVNDRGSYYYHMPFVQGVAEYHLPEFYTGASDFAGHATIKGSDQGMIFAKSGSMFFAPAPCSKNVVKDGNIHPFDNLEAIWATKEKFSLSPCFCRTTTAIEEGGIDLRDYPDGDFDLSDVTSPQCDCDVMTCLSCGEEAQFWIDHHVGREITKEEAFERLHKSIEDGFVMQHTMSKECETICSCTGHCCNILKAWNMIGSTATPTFQNTLHYTLEFTEDSCAKCGACAERCPMGTITMDDETGLPTVGGTCVSCGQCAYVCPTKSRWLVRKEPGTFAPIAEDIIDQGNVLAADRFERGLIW